MQKIKPMVGNESKLQFNTSFQTRQAERYP